MADDLVNDFLSRERDGLGGLESEIVGSEGIISRPSSKK